MGYGSKTVHCAGEPDTFCLILAVVATLGTRVGFWLADLWRILRDRDRVFSFGCAVEITCLVSVEGEILLVEPGLQCSLRGSIQMSFFGLAHCFWRS